IRELAGNGIDPSGNQRNHAIQGVSFDLAHGNTFGNHTITVADSTIDHFQKTGIFLTGPTLTVDVHDNTITGAGDIASTAQNGIQIGSQSAYAGTTGSVNHNTVSGIDYTPATDVGTGILTWHADHLSVTNNTVTGGSGEGDAGIYFLDSDAPTAS